jgi:hypothetical protein
MRQMTYATATVLMAAAFACSPRDPQETANRADSAAEDVRDAVREGADEVRDEARDARDYAYAQRNDFRRDIELRLEGLDEQVDRDLNRLASATESSWDEAKRSVNESVYALQEAVRRQLPECQADGGHRPELRVGVDLESDPGLCGIGPLEDAS